MKQKLNLGVFLSLGDSLASLRKSGQDARFINEYLKAYAKKFNVYAFSYIKEKSKLPSDCYLISNKTKLSRFVYQFFLPFYNLSLIKKINVIRVMQLTGVIPAIICKIVLNKPFVFTYGYDYVSFAKLENQKIRPVLLKTMERLAIKYAAVVIVTSKKMQSSLEKKYSQVKLAYIPNGVNIEKFKPLKKSANKRQSSCVNILFVGRLEKQKNLANLLKAVFLLSKSYKLKIVFIGQGKLKAGLEKLAKTKKLDLTIINKVSHSQMPKYYQQADFFVLPSYLEGHPKALLEAMASGLPCLVSDYPGLEFVDNREIKVTGFKDKEIAMNLKKLITDNNLRKKLGATAREKIKDSFSLEKNLEKEVNMLKNV
ncbi:glycosyltransferase family 4 protein [Patescibacteria group bacterium]